MRSAGTAAALLAALALPLAACAPSDEASFTRGAPGGPISGPGPTALPDILRFQATTAEGKPFDTGTLEGRPVLLWFYRTDCANCSAQAMEAALHRDMHPDQIHVLGVAEPTPAAALRDFISDSSASNFPHVVDEHHHLRERLRPKAPTPTSSSTGGARPSSVPTIPISRPSSARSTPSPPLHSHTRTRLGLRQAGLR
ncbi:peroxiredoxin family protein [Streptomyces sp. NPDC007903]|uniref:peroxiredoxin family protein n=1 Tax=Streptomyces sp. NPDC007903 TaxID=3364786 RepID=UPI0036EE1CB4